MRQVATYQGSCHCGAVQFQVETDFPELTTCDCSICSRKNAVMVKVHETRFKLLTGEQSLSEYQFHTHTAKHYFCKVCLTRACLTGQFICPLDRSPVTDLETLQVLCSEICHMFRCALGSLSWMSLA